MSSKVSQFILELSEVHKDGKDLLHFACKKRSEKQRSTMPVTAFVYQFFIYNSLYSIDWQSTFAQDDLVFQIEERSEGYKQQQFEEFLREQMQDRPKVVRSAFSPLQKIQLEATWIEIIPDPYIATEAGEEFFRRINQLCDFVNGSDDEIRNNIGRIFSRIQTCRLFVYQIRNNIFHGTKTLGQIWDPKQRWRIDVYTQFLQCLVSCFFELYSEQHSFSLSNVN